MFNAIIFGANKKPEKSLLQPLERYAEVVFSGIVG